MKKNSIIFLFGLMMVVIISCGKSNTKDARAHYGGSGNTSTLNTVSGEEKQKDWHL